jgi:hypothetical protein
MVDFLEKLFVQVIGLVIGIIVVVVLEHFN